SFGRWFIYDVFFFFQAEDGIRDKLVTGVQTCALPILQGLQQIQQETLQKLTPVLSEAQLKKFQTLQELHHEMMHHEMMHEHFGRSEERRVGKECRSRGWP